MLLPDGTKNPRKNTRRHQVTIFILFLILMTFVYLTISHVVSFAAVIRVVTRHATLLPISHADGRNSYPWLPGRGLKPWFGLSKCMCAPCLEVCPIFISRIFSRTLPRSQSESGELSRPHTWSTHTETPRWNLVRVSVLQFYAFFGTSMQLGCFHCFESLCMGLRKSKPRRFAGYDDVNTSGEVTATQNTSSVYVTEHNSVHSDSVTCVDPFALGTCVTGSKDNVSFAF